MREIDHYYTQRDTFEQHQNQQDVSPTNASPTTPHTSALEHTRINTKFSFGMVRQCEEDEEEEEEEEVIIIISPVADRKIAGTRRVSRSQWGGI